MRNPPWNKDELILALDLYFSLSYGQMDGKHPKVKILSNLLTLMNENEGFTRSVNSVSLKLANFKRIDPEFAGFGMVGGGNLEEEIWDKYYNNKKELRKDAITVKESVLEKRKLTFMKWLSENGKPDNTPYQQRTINAYASQIKKDIFTEFSIDRGTSLYEITDQKELAEVNKLLYTGKESKRRRDLRSAFQSYVRFIQEEKLQNDADTMLDYEGESSTEGGRRVYMSSRAERNKILRKKAIEIHGTSCIICGFNFGKIYGSWGEGFIEVHHVVPLGSDGKEKRRLTDARKDLVVLCANCHRMIHRKKGITLTIEGLKRKINDTSNG